MEIMNISVIVPVYNAEQYIKECICSVLNQSYSKFELILVDDGSTDNSGEICDLYAGKDKRIKVIHKSNEGATCARITGMEAAQYDYISFVDADDWLEESFLECLINEMISAKADIVISGCINEMNGVSTNVINRIYRGVYEGEKLTSYFYAKMLCFEGFFQFGIQPYMWNKLFRKELLKKCYRGMDMQIYDGEDAAVIYPYLLQAERVAVIDACLYHYRRHKGSVSFEKGPDFYANVSRLYLHLYEVFTESKHCTVLLQQLNEYMRRMVWFGTPKGFMQEAWQYFPFRDIPCGTQIIIYGAGVVGKKYYHQIKETNYCSIVSWVDQRWMLLREQGLCVESPDIVKHKKYDYIVVANARKEIRNEIKMYLMSLGVKQEQIITGEI